tara:strand:- start:1346 stop:2392 length:1047 start_codon:yes stop_codon:yes gene_type:complete
MKYFKFITIILIILFKTGNYLYAESIFTVNNIQVNKNSFKNKEELINIAFRKGFEKLNNKILLEKDYLKTKNVSLRIIKNLVSHYQIVKNEDKNIQNFEIVNLYFKRDKMYNFYSKNNIKYSDVSGKILNILPVLIVEDETFIYDRNFFYENWLKTEKNNDSKNIEYIFPIENLEIIETIKKNQNNLEVINLTEIFDENYEKDNLLIILDYKKQKTRIFLKGIISSKKIVKNLSFENKAEKKIEYPKILKFLKKEILELVKSQNIIDIGAPAFLNINLALNNQKDLFSFQNILSEIDLIENFNVKEFNNKFAYINIKYYGKINKFKEKLIEKEIDINFKNNQWSARLK